MKVNSNPRFEEGEYGEWEGPGATADLTDNEHWNIL